MSPWIATTTVVRMFELIKSNKREFILKGYIHSYSRRKKFSIRLSKDDAERILSELNSINISLIPPKYYVLDGEEYHLVIEDFQNKIELKWSSEPKDGWKQLDPFINKIIKLIPDISPYD